MGIVKTIINRKKVEISMQAAAIPLYEVEVALSHLNGH